MTGVYNLSKIQSAKKGTIKGRGKRGKREETSERARRKGKKKSEKVGKEGRKGKKKRVNGNTWWRRFSMRGLGFFFTTFEE